MIEYASMTDSIRNTIGEIDWSAYQAAHGPASQSIEVDGDSQGFIKRLFSGPPPKKKVGNIPELLERLIEADDEVDALKTYRILAPALCGNEFVSEAAAPAFPFLMECLDDALKSSKLNLADNLLELLSGIALNCYRNAAYPKGDWVEELFNRLQDNLDHFKAIETSQELETSKTRLVHILDRAPVEVYELSQKLEWLPEGEIRFLNDSRVGNLEKELQELGFKIYKVDAENIEMDNDLSDYIGRELLGANEEIEQWNTTLLSAFIQEHFQPEGDSKHIAVLVTNFSESLAYLNNRENLLAEIEALVILTQRREENLLSGPNQIEYFFFLDQKNLTELAEMKEGVDSTSKDCLCFDPENVDYFRARAYSQVDRGNLSEAARYYTKALDLAPDDFGLLRERAQLLRLLGRFEEAVDDCTRAIELNEFSLAHCERARSYLELEEYEKAIQDCEEELERAKEDEADSWVPHYLIARARLGTGELDQAMDACERSLKVAVTKEGYELRAQINEARGDQESASLDSQKAETTRSGNPGVL